MEKYDQKEKFPMEHLLSGPYYDHGDCPNYGSSDCYLCRGSCEFDEEDLKEILQYKYK